MKTQLYIEGKEVELDKSVQFALNKQFEELSNPTTIINDWSKTVSIPFTASNNRLFGYLYKPERVIVGTSNPDSYKSMGIYFDPTKKLDFRLVYNTITLMTGYAKVNSVKQSKGKGTYEMTLFGQLGKIFQEMQRLTFDESSPDIDYIIDGSTYYYEAINKDLIYNSWVSTGQQQAQLYPRLLVVPGGSTVNHPAYHPTDIIGWAPNNSFSEGFDYKTFQYNDSSTSTFAEALEGESGESFKNATGISADTVIPNGMLPREIGEYRSYLQLPFIYWNKLFQVFQKKAEAITGYKFDLDTDWFKTANPYWYKLVYMLKGLNFVKAPTYNNSYGVSQYGAVQLITPNDATQTSRYDFSRQSNNLRFSTTTEQYSLLNPDGTAFICDGSNVIDGKLTLTVTMKALNPWLTSDEYITRMRNNSVINLDVYMNYNGTSSMIGRVCVKFTGSSYYASGSTYVVDKNTETLTASNQDFDLISGMQFSFDIPSQVYNGSVSFYYKLSGWHAEGLNGTLFVERDGNSWSSINLGNIQTTVTATSTFSISSLIGKSDSYISLNTLWNNDFNLFNEIIKYCKIFRIAITVDDMTKTIKFQAYKKYFSNYSILDWTDKIDMSKDFAVTPLAFDSKYVLFNYKDSKTKLGGEYKEKYGINYGEYRLQTDYNFNTETKELFKDITLSITNTDNVLSWTNIYDNRSIQYSFPSEISVYNKDKDGKQVDLFGAYYFFDGRASFSTEAVLNLRSVSISDDTTLQQNSKTYFYSQLSSASRSCSYYPKLNVVTGAHLCLFNVPKQNYTYQNNYSGRTTIYGQVWQNYINERYNVQNKLVTCYIRLTPSDFASFKFSNFVKIDNHLYMVNKIYDYDVTSSAPTKVDLITVQDINGYRS